MNQNNQIFKSIHSIIKDLAKNPIVKNDVNQHQRYKYRGIEAICNGLSPLFAKYGVIVYPQVLELSTEARGKMYNSVVKVIYTFVSSEDGSKFEVTVMGEGSDSQDKSINKAHTSAYKNCMNQTFCIPTEAHEDPDAQSPISNTVDTKQPEYQSQPRRIENPANPAQIQRISELVKQTSTDINRMLGTYKVGSINELSVQAASDAISKLTQKMSNSQGAIQ